MHWGYHEEKHCLSVSTHSSRIREPPHQCVDLKGAQITKDNCKTNPRHLDEAVKHYTTKAAIFIFFFEMWQRNITATHFCIIMIYKTRDTRSQNDSQLQQEKVGRHSKHHLKHARWSFRKSASGFRCLSQQIFWRLLPYKTYKTLPGHWLLTIGNVVTNQPMACSTTPTVR